MALAQALASPRVELGIEGGRNAKDGSNVNNNRKNLLTKQSRRWLQRGGQLLGCLAKSIMGCSDVDLISVAGPTTESPDERVGKARGVSRDSGTDPETMA